VTDARFTHRLRVRYHETDAQQIVYNARYLEYVDVAMTEWFRELGWAYPDLVAAGFDPTLLSMTIEWRRPAVFDEEIDVAVSLEQMGTSSYTLAFEVSRVAGAEPLVSAKAVYVNFDPDTQRSRPIPAFVRERMISHADEELVTDGKR
jgi:acyl-CoA thioester hydrolase